MGVFEKVLLAVDGSREAERAARAAVEVCGKLGAELHLAHVGVVPQVYGGPEAVLYDPDIQDRLSEAAEKEARRVLEEQRKRVEELGGSVAASHTRAGRADREIVELAEDLDADLVVLGSRGLGPLRRALIGSVSMSVVRHAHCPVLVVRPPDGTEVSMLGSRVLLATDGSEHSEEAARAAVELADATGSELHVLYSLPTVTPLPYPHPLAPEKTEEWLRQAREEARGFLDRQAEQIEAVGGTVSGKHLKTGPPDQNVVRLAEQIEAGVVVLGSRGLGGLRRALLGSVSDSVVRHAHCPVLVVRR